MKRFENSSTPWICSVAVVLMASAIGCGGDNSGNGDTNAILRPTVRSVTPVNNATDVPISSPAITATFSEQMAPITGTASVTMTSELFGTVAGSVALDSTKRIATFTPTNILAPFTRYTVTINGAMSNTTGRDLQYAYVWSFTTGLALAVNEASVEK